MKTSVSQWCAFAAVLAGIGLFACSSGPTGPSPDESVIPLQIGNAWSYSYSDTTGQYRQDIRVIDLSQGRYTLQYIDYFRDGDLGWNSGGYYRAWNESDGYYDGEALKFKYPVETGDEYMRDGNTVAVKSVEDSVTVPAGDFQCIRYHFNNATYWVAPGIGLVKQKWGTISSKELLEYYVQSHRNDI